MADFSAQYLRLMQPPGNSQAVAPSDGATFRATVAIIPPEDGAVAYVNAETGETTIAPALKAGVQYAISCTAILATGTASSGNFVIFFPPELPS